SAETARHTHAGLVGEIVADEDRPAAMERRMRHQPLDRITFGRRTQADLDRLARRDQAEPGMVGWYQVAYQFPHLGLVLGRQAIVDGEAVRLGLDPHAGPRLDPADKLGAPV